MSCRLGVMLSSHSLRCYRDLAYLLALYIHASYLVSTRLYFTVGLALCTSEVKGE